MNLKGRLKLVADKVPLCGKVCDIGTDHAYIPIYLVLNKVCESAIAGDVRKGPLEAAINNIREYGLEEKIEARLGFGLDVTGENESDVLVIAGMGGELITEILSRGFQKAAAAQCIILQPMGAIGEVREWLYENGFDISDEELTAEGEKIYDVMSVRWDGVARELGEINFYVGAKLLERNDDLVKKYIRKRVNQLNEILSGIRKTNSDRKELEERYLNILDKLSDLLNENEGNP